MICQPCAKAADQNLGPAAHCGDPKCPCQHRPPGTRQTNKEQS